MIDNVPSITSLVKQIRIENDGFTSTKSHIPTSLELQAQESKERARIQTQIAKKDLIFHYACIVHDYVRNSAFENKKYSSNFIYDKALADHSRSMDPKTIKSLQAMDLEWFKTLDDLNQMLVVLGLIRHSSLYLSYQICHEAWQMYRNPQVNEKDSWIQLKKADTGKPLESEYNLQPIPNLIGSLQRSEDLKVKQLPIKPEDEFKGIDPNSPYLIEVKRRRAMWDAMIKKYKLKVDDTPEKVEEPKGKGADKKEKSSKDKDTKSKKEDNFEAVDEIQLLPFWVVLRIFGYLDKKTLAKVKSVNTYWEFAVNELAKFQKARKQMDKIIEQWEKKLNLAPHESTEKPKGKVQLMRNSNEGDLPKKRLLKLAQRGTVIPKLRPKRIENRYSNCIVLDALRETPENFILPVRNFNVFPRDFPLSTPSLYKPRTCIINELGFTKVEAPQIEHSSLSIDDFLLHGNSKSNSIASKIGDSYWL